MTSVRLPITASRRTASILAATISLSLATFQTPLSTVVRAEDFVAPFNTELATDRSLAPSEVCATAQLPEGFRLSVFAAEPDVQNPISMTTDHRGRLWVAENYTWAGARDGNFENRLNDRIIVLEDADGDGRMDRRKVFWDRARQLTSVEVGFGGVWALCPPQLLFIPDADGDDVPDGPPTVVLDGFDVESVQHTVANGLKWGPDGWLYGRQGILGTSHVGAPGSKEADRMQFNTGVWRFHPVTRRWEVVMHGMTNPWGFDFNEVGEMFVINTVIGHLWHVIPGGRTERMSGVDFNPHAYQLLKQVADHVHWDDGEPWQAVRDGATDKTNAAGGGHAHTGLLIYQGDNWPSHYRGKAFTLNIHGRRINCDHLQRTSVGYTAAHGADMCFIKDRWFRGMDLINSADGSVFISDWSDTGECHDLDGVHRTSGRVYKLAYGDKPAARRVSVAALSDSELAGLQTHPNDWYTRHARQVLQERAAAGALAADGIRAELRELFAKSANPIHRLRAFWALQLTGQAPAGWLTQQLHDRDESVRAWAIRYLVEDPAALASDPTVFADCMSALEAVAAEDSSGLVLLHLASSLQRLPEAARWSIGRRLAARSESQFSGSATLSVMLWLALEPIIGSDHQRGLELIATTSFPQIRQNAARRVGYDIDDSPADVERLLALAAQEPALAPEILKGLSLAISGRRDCPTPSNWSQLYPVLSSTLPPESRGDLNSLGVTFRDPQVLNELRRTVESSGPSADERRAALKLLLAGRPVDLGPLLVRLVADPALAVEAIRGLELYDDVAFRSKLLAHFASLPSEARTAVIGMLAARPESARQLMQAVAEKLVAPAEISAFHARQMLSLEDEQLSTAIRELWGDVRTTPEEKRTLIASYRDKLSAESLASADAAAGKQVFAKSCAACHTLFGEGGKVGPDLTGSDRKNLGYLLENMIDPSAIVDAGHRTTLFMLADGRVVTGIVREKNEHTVTVENQDGKTTIDVDDIDQSQPSDVSLMPEGILQGLSEGDVRNLMAYLMSD